ncbi:ribonuclease H [Caulobacter segnis]|uniref:Ribonuclease H n=2 Tax=Caulobacter segnis TaxID=88688 RepID=D5VM98_CAUST|nr:ribonuclease H [Caulobacter segnis]ADG11621.1 ribonuclease H [Caulobacter segnis ATCC 21756]AVQ03271.1 ribonuclease H [Caulobacter segnis]
MVAVTLWIASLCRQDPSYGGWSYVRRIEGETGAAAIKGAAGGERRTTGAKMSLTALTEALEGLSDLPADAAVTLRFSDLELAGQLVAPDGEYATTEPDAWAAARAAVAARPVLEMVPASAGDGTNGFLAAWAEFGLDTSKSRGSFKAAIPKPNLMKFPG